MTQEEAPSNYLRLFKEFLRQSSINGLHPFLYPTPIRYAKALWLTLMAAIVVWTHVVIVNLTLEYLDQPTEIHMAPDLVHVANSPFPAVGVCTANKISQRLLRSYAVKLYQHQEKSNSNDESTLQRVALDVDDMAERLLVLAQFYLNPLDTPRLDEAQLQRLHWLLSSYHNDTGYSVRDILRQLSADCGELIIRGIVYGSPVNTSQMFVKRPTSSNVCCIFNYRRPSYSQIAHIRAEDNAEMRALPKVVFESNSILNSVQFVLQDTPEDDQSNTFMTNNAFQLTIFPQEDYATVQSTTLGEILVDHNTIVEIPIQPTFFSSSEGVRTVSPEARRCYFPEEGRKLINQSYYSIDECLLLCRSKSMMDHCGCVSPPMIGSSTDLKYCSLPDLPCLTKWKSIWYGYDEFAYLQEGESQAAQGQCTHCLPTCNGVSFSITSNVAPLRLNYNGTGYRTGLLKGLTNERPLAVIKFFFKLRFAQATKSELVSTWVVLLNRFGGILSLMYGFSIVSYIEIFYYLTGKWFVYICRAFTKRQPPRPVRGNNSLYWDELMPKGLGLRVHN
ncbi:sodium channel protein Nach isoform X3 [Drosophila miranda]|uniref:sodium channel protein Nach isoform X3 n=1 Tax=Drosophila miranda TaxID=7229 RepID=UPI0007E5CFE2|nr:sodium channel protein Nach isoform X3 [Drosophila miranda]